jgi:hypothetical protein
MPLDDAIAILDKAADAVAADHGVVTVARIAAVKHLLDAIRYLLADL